jgi:hypothetical protein
MATGLRFERAMAAKALSSPAREGIPLLRVDPDYRDEDSGQLKTHS